MAAREKATVEAELAGIGKFVSDAEKAESAVEKIGTTAGKVGPRLQGALKTVGGAVAGLLSDGLRAAGVLQTLSLANAVEDAKRLDLATAKLGQSAGVSGTILKSNFDAIEKRTLTSSVAMADFSRALGRATYDSRFAADSVGSLGDEALAVGRDLGDELPIAVALRDLGVNASGVTSELGRLRDIAERVDTIGGPTALKDTFAALGPLLSGVSTQTDEARAKLEALIGVLGKGLKPQQATAVGAAALSQVRARALDIERATGRRVLDDQGNLIDPTRALADIKRIAERRFGKNKEAQRRALISDFGQELGLSIYRTDFGDVDKLAKEAQDRGKTGKEAEQFRKSKEGQRIDAQLKKDQELRGAGEKLLGIHDTLVGNLGVGGALAVELGGGQLALSGAKALGGKALAAAGAGTAATVGAVTASFALPAAAVLSDIGQDREALGKRYRDEHANVLGAEIAQAAIQRGDLTPVIGRAHGDEKVIEATLAVLNAKFDQLNATLQGQANAFAEAVGRKPLKVQMPFDPNAPKGQ